MTKSERSAVTKAVARAVADRGGTGGAVTVAFDARRLTRSYALTDKDTWQTAEAESVAPGLRHVGGNDLEVEQCGRVLRTCPYRGIDLLVAASAPVVRGDTARVAIMLARRITVIGNGEQRLSREVREVALVRKAGDWVVLSSEIVRQY
jgi:hypothetical protein